jgi:hypothetical protein
MDDVALITDNIKDMEKLLENTDQIANRYKIEFGKEKSNIMQINGKQAKHPVKIGSFEVEYTDKYTYLGFTINNKNSLEDHLTNIRTKTEAAYQTILNIMYNKEFSLIQMSTMWKLVETCVIPVITYASETWILNKTDTKNLNQILDNILKRILIVPQGTPREALYIETNLLDIERTIEKKKLNMYYRISKNGNKLTQYLIQNEKRTVWQNDIENIAKKYSIKLEELIQMKPGKAKRHIKKNIQKEFRQEMFTNRQNKSKITYLKKGYIGQEKANYTNVLTREETSILFKTRTRMLDIKANYKNKYSDLTCRLCKKEEETQEHIINWCEVTIQQKLALANEVIFLRGKTNKKKVVETVKQIMNMIELAQ